MDIYSSITLSMSIVVLGATALLVVRLVRPAEPHSGLGEFLVILDREFRGEVFRTSEDFVLHRLAEDYRGGISGLSVEARGHVLRVGRFYGDAGMVAADWGFDTRLPTASFVDESLARGSVVRGRDSAAPDASSMDATCTQAPSGGSAPTDAASTDVAFADVRRVDAGSGEPPFTDVAVPDVPVVDAAPTDPPSDVALADGRLADAGRTGPPVTGPALTDAAFAGSDLGFAEAAFFGSRHTSPAPAGEPFMGVLHGRAAAAWAVLQPYVEVERKRRGGTWWKHFENLATHRDRTQAAKASTPLTTASKRRGHRAPPGTGARSR
jgi:hypothetical protein